MKKLLTMLILVAWALSASANDGVFYAAGNQLIPIVETDIIVKKEVLSIVRQGDYAIIDVYYEFFNPTKAKTLLVGFEAPTPYNATFNFSDYHDSHPFISDFTVNLNGKDLPYKVALVENDSIYYKNGEFIYADMLEEKESIELSGSPFGQYVYHFTATFRPGLNIIHHRYKYRLSSSVVSDAGLYYTLTAANRWANRQIDDFTLNIDMGKHTSFCMPLTFFENLSEWQFNGIGLCNKLPSNFEGGDYKHEYVSFHIQSGYITFHKENFHPKGELTAEFYHYLWDFYEKDSLESMLDYIKTHYLTGNLDEKIPLLNDYLKINKPEVYPDNIRKIMRNLPWAYRGYVFKDKKLQKFFESTQWYIANPAYNGSQEDFSSGDKKWVRYWDLDENSEIIE